MARESWMNEARKKKKEQKKMGNKWRWNQLHMLLRWSQQMMLRR